MQFPFLSSLAAAWPYLLLASTATLVLTELLANRGLKVGPDAVRQGGMVLSVALAVFACEVLSLVGMRVVF